MPFFNHGGQLIHYDYTDVGKKQTLVFIHSLGTDFRIWNDVTKHLAHLANILLFDNRGHGLSGVCPSPNGLEDFTDDLTGLLDHLHIRDHIIPVGLSVGGIIAQILVDRIPEKISAMVLCDTRFKIGNKLNWNERIFQVKNHGIEKISDAVVERWFSADFRTQFPDTVMGYKFMLERTPVDGYIQTCEAIRDADTSEIAQRISLPVLCIAGAEDKSTTPEEVKNLADLIPGSLYFVIEGSGHLPCLDNALKLFELISDFIPQP